MIFNELQKSSLRVLLDSPGWNLVMQLVENYCNNIKSNSTVRDNEWETLRETLKQDGKVEGIRNFIQEIYLQAKGE